MVGGEPVRPYELPSSSPECDRAVQRDWDEHRARLREQRATFGSRVLTGWLTERKHDRGRGFTVRARGYSIELRVRRSSSRLELHVWVLRP